jgi:esterase/lipase
MHITVVHGLGGTADTVWPVVEALQAHGHEVLAPTLAGHSTRPDDLITAGWAQWLSCVPAHTDVVIGQSMGGSLALTHASQQAAASIGAVVAINPVAPDPDALDALEWMRERGREWIEVAASTVGERCYDRLPIAALQSMHDGILASDWSAVRCPTLIVTSDDDDVVDPASSDVIAHTLEVGGALVRRLGLAGAGHVATLGPKRTDLITAIIAFVSTIAAGY